MEIQNVDPLECLEENLPHLAMSQAVKEHVVRKHPQDTMTRLDEEVLRVSEKLDEVVVEVDLLLAQAALVVIQKAQDEPDSC